MTLYSTSTRQPSLSGPSETKHFPYRVFIKVTPDQANGRRLEYYRDQEKIAQDIEDLLLEAGLNIAAPVAFTPQIGQAPARITVIGFDPDTTHKNDPPIDQATQPSIIHSGTVPGEKTSLHVYPTGGSLSWGQDPKLRVDNAVVALKEDIEMALLTLPASFIVFFIDYNGVKYGSSPNRKAFRSFPA